MCAAPWGALAHCLGNYYYAPSTDEETEAKRDEVPGTGPHSQEAAESEGANPGIRVPESDF